MTALRRQDKLAEEPVAWEVLARAPSAHLAATLPDGTPLLRVLHPVVLDGAVWFHGAPAGEKEDAVGRPVVVEAHEIVAEIPSTFTDPARACPATTFYRSAMLHGVLEPVHEPSDKARALQALMERFQPQGGHRPIRHDDPLYAAAVRGIRILRVVPERVVAKVALGQMKSPDVRRRIAEGLWRRGAPGDAAAVEAVVGAAPLDPLPAFLNGPGGTRLVVAPDARHLPGAVALLRGEYWNRGVPDEVLAEAQRGSAAWVVALDGDEVVGTSRGLSDGVKTAYVADVCVASAWRGRGLGAALVERLLDHPALRRVGRVDLLTRDAGPFYGKLGFARLDGREIWRRSR